MVDEPFPEGIEKDINIFNPTTPTPTKQQDRVIQS
jgi:hypothetical protein